jgi:hypothetical protein
MQLYVPICRAYLLIPVTTGQSGRGTTMVGHGHGHVSVWSNECSHGCSSMSLFFSLSRERFYDKVDLPSWINKTPTLPTVFPPCPSSSHTSRHQCYSNKHITIPDKEQPEKAPTHTYFRLPRNGSCGNNNDILQPSLVHRMQSMCRPWRR